MSKRDSTLTQERLKVILHYDSDTGVFTRRIRTSQNNRAGDIAGGIGHANAAGYKRLVISVDGQPHFAHRLAWLYVYGMWPDEIDHIDRDPLNNRINNLRNVCRTQNMQNTGTKPACNSTSGFRGVFYEKRQRKWIAKINVGGKQIHLGTHLTPEAAHVAYLSAKKQFHS